MIGFVYAVVWTPLAKRIAPRPKTLNEAQSSIRFTEK